MGQCSGMSIELVRWISGAAVVQLDDPVAEGGAGDQIESVGPGDIVEQPGALARNVGGKVKRFPRMSWDFCRSYTFSASERR